MNIAVAPSVNLHRVEELLHHHFGGQPLQRVLLVVPPDAGSQSFSFATGKTGRYWNYPAYGLGVIATHARADGLYVHILNLNNVVLEACRLTDREEDFDFEAIVDRALRDELSGFAPHLIGVTCMFSHTHNSAVEVCGWVRAMAPSTALAIGGVHITNSFMGSNKLTGDPTRAPLLNAFSTADFIFLFEAEIAFRDFCRVVNGTMQVEALGQFVALDGSAYHHLPASKKPEGAEMDAVPAADLLDIKRLNANGKMSAFHFQKAEGTIFSTVLTNRGCRAQCTFCSVRNFNGVGVRSRSVQSVIDEILVLRHEYGVGHINWLDDDFLYNIKRAMTLFNELIRQDVGVTWDCTNGVIAASVTPEVARAAAASGCVGLFIGMESGNPQTLREIKKPGTVKNFLAAAEALRPVEQIYSRVFLMIGFPGETYSRIMDTINVAREMDLDWYGIQTLQPLPNTPIFASMIADGLIGQNINFDEIRFSTGAHGKSRKTEQGSIDALARDFKDVFSNVDMKAIPNSAALQNIWSNMDYNLNVIHLLKETKPAKLRQQLDWLNYILTVIVPDNAIMQYCRATIDYRVHGMMNPELIERLDRTLVAMPYWAQRFADLGLATEDLRALHSVATA